MLQGDICDGLHFHLPDCSQALKYSSLMQINPDADLLELTKMKQNPFGEGSEEYLNKSIEKSVHNFNSTVNENDKIITLVTCYDISTYHLVVHAKLIKQGRVN